MSQFDDAIEFVLRNEQGYVNHPMDKGGPTNYGITLKTLCKYRKVKKLTFKDVKTLKVSEAKEIYKVLYWDKLNIDFSHYYHRNTDLDVLLLDQAVNRGVKPAVRQLQKILDLKTDGIVGANTRSAFLNLMISSNKKDCSFELKYIQASQHFYLRLVKRKPNQMVFLKGWINRTHEMLNYVFEY